MNKWQYRKLMAAVVFAIALFILAMLLVFNRPANLQINNYVGKSAYQSAIDTGLFKGTETQWARSLVPAVPKDGKDGKDSKSTHTVEKTVEKTTEKEVVKDTKPAREVEIRTNPETKDREWRLSGMRGWTVLIAYCEIKDTCEVSNE